MYNRHKLGLWLTLIVWFGLFSCTKEEPIELINYPFPNKLNIPYQPVKQQKYGIYATDGVFMTNDFPAGRAHGLKKVNDSTFSVQIHPENEPIGNTPWYALKIWSQTQRLIYLELDYGHFQHRYHPKISKDGIQWSVLSCPEPLTNLGEHHFTFPLELDTSFTWVAAQEIIDYQKVGSWVKQLARFNCVEFGIAGESILGRNLYYLDIGTGEKNNKPTIIIFSRQHPSEVSGYIFMQYLVEYIINSGNYEFLDTYRILVYPLMNPDGVDLGHWRHNMGGVDLNGDWSYYNQKEIKDIAEHILKETSQCNNNIVLGLDFHSTERNMLLTFDHTLTSKMYWFTPEWTEQISNVHKDDDLEIKPMGLQSPVSKGWFYIQFGAESLTFEIEDEADRQVCKERAHHSADHMMEILLENESLLN